MPNSKRVWFPALLFVLTISNNVESKARSQLPHIVFVMADDLGYRDVGYHGSEFATPYLDSLANSGVKLENYYVQPVCSPTRQQLLSGRYQIRTGLVHKSIESGQRSGLPLDSATLPEKLREAGYATHLVGKWHLGYYKNDYMPTNRGFDTFYGFLNGYEKHYTHMLRNEIDLRRNEHVDRSATGIYSTHLFSTEAVKVIDNHPADKPLFLDLSYQAVHGPLEVPSSYSDKFSDISDPDRRTFAGDDRSVLCKAWYHCAMSSRVWSYDIGKLTGMVNCMEEGIQNVTRALIDNHMWHNTIFIFSTDNGGNVRKGGNNWPLRGWKGSLWEGGIRGVAFVHSALLKQHGVVSNELIHVSDWFPTLMNIAHGNLNGTLPLDGLDQWSTISEGQPSPRTELLHNIDPLTPKNGRRSVSRIFDTTVRAALRHGDMKIVTGDPGVGSWVPPPDQNLTQIGSVTQPSKNVWLFNIKDDPNEMNDLADSHPIVVRSLLERLAHYNSESVPAYYPDADPLSAPHLNGDAWGPWVSD